MKTLETKSNQGLIYSFLGWKPCKNEIVSYEKCIRNDVPLQKDPTQCYSQAKTLQQCYNDRATSVQPLCLPIFNDVRQCLFKADSHVFGCKQQLNQLVYCNQNPQQYVQFLKWSTPAQKKAKSYDFTYYAAGFQSN